jgi:Leucine-rich repeat (LRR) protein
MLLLSWVEWQDLHVARLVNKQIKSSADVVLQEMWRQIWTGATVGGRPILDRMMFSIAPKTTYTEGAISSHFARFFQQLFRKFATDYDLKPRPNSPHSLEVQCEELHMQIQDRDLEAIWAVMQDKILHLPDMPTPTAAVIRSWMNDNADQLQLITELDLADLNLRVIPAEVGLLTGLQYLDLCHNRIQELPPEMNNLTRLVGLRLAHNQLRAVPTVLRPAAGFQLDLSHNQIQEISSVGQFTEMVALILSHNHIQVIPSEMLSLVGLLVLDLSHNQIQTIPPEIKQMTQLRSLYISSNNITEISPELGQLEELQSLCLSNNEITEIPLALGRLAQLRILDLSATLIAEIPEALKRLRLTHLHRLILPHTPPLARILQETRRLNGISQQAACQEIRTILSSLPPEEHAQIFQVLSRLTPGIGVERLLLEGCTVKSGPVQQLSIFRPLKERLEEAIGSIIRERLEQLSCEKKNEVYREIYRLAGSPETEDPQWGEHRAQTDLILLAEALVVVFVQDKK